MAQGVLEGRIAIVTGAGSTMGIGRAMTLAMVRAGARVAMVDVNQGELEQSAQDARDIGGDDAVLPLVVDISNAGGAERAVAAAIEHFGGLHVLANNAGISLSTSGFSSERRLRFWEIPVEAWERVMAVNLTGAFNMTRAAVRPMLAQASGRIISVTTSLDTMIRAYGAPYGPSKAGHEAFIAVAAHELEGTGVTANILVPGGSTNTNLSGQANARPASEREALIQPEVMGPPAVWLASEESAPYNAMRFVALQWDEDLPLEDRIRKAGAPAAWPQLGRPEEARGQELGKKL